MSAGTLQEETLYIVGNLSHDKVTALLPSDSTGGISVVLIQEAVSAANVPAASVKVLDEDLRRQRAASSYPRITYAELLDMIFRAKRVIVL